MKLGKWVKPAVLERLRRLTSLLLRHTRASTTAGDSQLSQRLGQAIDNAVIALQNVETVEEIEKLEAQVKKLIHIQTDTEQRRNAQRLDAVRKLVATVGSELTGMSEDAADLAAQFNEQINGLLLFASEEQANQFRDGLRSEVLKLRRLLENKQSKEQQRMHLLQERTQQLEAQLDRAKEEMLFDPLTQCYNRRAFDARLSESVGHNSRYGGQLALVMFDIDHFKNVNDRHGHLVGDKVLSALGGTARQVFRQEDFIARYGGEEFAAILDDTGAHYAAQVAERFRLTVANKAFQYEVANKQRALQLTVSLGVATLRPADTPESLIERADQALYLAKGSGRNQFKTEMDLE